MKTSKNKSNVIQVFFKLVPIVSSFSPVLFMVNNIINVLHGAAFSVQVFMQQRFFDAAASLAESKTTMKVVLLSLAFLSLAYIITQILNAAGNYVPQVLVSKIGGKNAFLVYQKVGRLSPELFENTAKLDDMNKAEAGRENAIWFVYIISIIIFFYIPYFAFMGWYLFQLKPSLAFAIVLVFIPVVLTQIIRIQSFSKLEDNSAPIRREFDYYETCMTGREYLKETRLLGGFQFFYRRYMGTLKTLQTMQWKTNLRSNFIELFMSFFTVCGYTGIIFLLFDALMKQEISVGAFVTVFNSIGMLYGIMEEVIYHHIGKLTKNLGTIQNYINFLELEERQKGEAVLEEHFDITLKDVSFSYQGSDKKALFNINLTLHDKETLAVVGENGSGKSTLIRLITGLYLPQEGTVFFGKTDSRAYFMKQLFSKTSAVFQKYQKYQMTLEDNICISDSKTMKQTDKEKYQKIQHACEMAGVSIEDKDFPNGINTMLSREFNGVDLSGGEWQRIAIARAFYRPHQLIILDEPTAAIDPYEETRIYNKFAELSKDKTAVIVTHRIGSVKLADRIAVMKQGRLVELGTHQQLLAMGGEYTRLYQAQQQWYEDKN